MLAIIAGHKAIPALSPLIISSRPSLSPHQSQHLVLCITP